MWACSVLRALPMALRGLCALCTLLLAAIISLSALLPFLFLPTKSWPTCTMHIYRALKSPLSARFPFPCVYCVWPLWDFPYKSKTWVYCFKRIGCTIVVPFVQCTWTTTMHNRTVYGVAPWWRCHNTFPFLAHLPTVLPVRACSLELLNIWHFCLIFKLTLSCLFPKLDF